MTEIEQPEEQQPTVADLIRQKRERRESRGLDPNNEVEAARLARRERNAR